jgi:hypothetical protein
MVAQSIKVSVCRACESACLRADGSAGRPDLSFNRDRPRLTGIVLSETAGAFMAEWRKSMTL